MSTSQNRIFNSATEGRATLARLPQSVLSRPWLTAGLVLYWLWFNITFQSPMLFPSLSLTAEFTLPTVVAPIFVCLVVYVAVAMGFRRLNRLVRHKHYLLGLAALMVVGAVANILWVMSGWQFTAFDAPLLEAAERLTPLAIACFCVGAVLIGTVTAALNIEWGRIFGRLGPMQAILLSIVGYLTATLLSFVVSLAPYPLTLVVSLLIPLPLALCVRRAQREFARSQFYSHGLETTLYLPWKFLLTALLHGLSLGALLGLYSLASAEGTLLPLILLSYVCAGILLLITVLTVRMDFNHLIYQVGFTLVAVGAFCIVWFYPDLRVGSFIQYLGTCYLHLLMWGLCAYLTKHFELPADWVIAGSTACFMLGQLLGMGVSASLAQLPAEEAAVPQLFLVMLLVVLVASNLLLSNRNLRTGWGLVRPGAGEADEAEVALIAELLSTGASLTNRESEVLIFLVKGWSRRAISAELVISEETVKSHTHSVYRKLLVGSQQELIALFAQRQESLRD